MRSALPWLVAVALAALVWWHAGIVVPFLLSLVLAYVLEPAVDRLQRCRVPRALAVALCILLVFVIGSVSLVLLVPIVSQLVPMLRSEMPGLLSKVWSEAEPRLSQLGLNLPDNLEELKAELAAILQTHGAEWGSAIWHSVVVGGSRLMALAGLALLVPMLAFYWLLDWDRLTRLERQVASLRDRMGVEEALGFPSRPKRMSDDERQKKIDLIRRILDDDKEIRTHTEPWLDNVRQMLTGQSRERAVRAAYDKLDR